MTMSRRSTTGCTACKNRRKKCDEGKPQCQRCLTSRIPCSYDFIEYPSSVAHLVQRTRPAPRPVAELLASLSRDLASSNSSNSALPASPNLSETVDVLPPIHFASHQQSFSGLSSSRLPPGLLQWVTGVSRDTPTQPTSVTSQVARSYHDDCEDYDPEGIHAVLCTAPTMHRNLKENTLPFVLQCYAQWAIVSVFEPLKIAHTMKEQVVQQFSSEDTRTRCILMANVMEMFGRQLVVDETRLPIVTHLTSEVRASCSSFIALWPSESLVPGLDKQNAMRILDSTLEIMTLQIYTQPMAACIQLMEEAAPVFRRACSEPPGQALNLPNILLESGLNLRHYASIDVMTSTLTGRPTFFKYYVPFSLELCELELPRAKNGIGMCFAKEFLIFESTPHHTLLETTPGCRWRKCGQGQGSKDGWLYGQI
ncbi:hypothetical protein RSAG8_05995, partial [Rhizoctonia solani AG-8 WAC10335]